MQQPQQTPQPAPPSPPFNSLFEMHSSRMAGRSADTALPFNSLFEMHEHMRQARELLASELLSILYLRCLFTAALYGATIAAFNSLFEMHMLLAKIKDFDTYAAFNSLFEMPDRAAAVIFYHHMSYVFQFSI